jgi:hypothetical protein
LFRKKIFLLFITGIKKTTTDRQRNKRSTCLWHFKIWWRKGQ